MVFSQSIQCTEEPHLTFNIAVPSPSFKAIRMLSPEHWDPPNQ
jgi:hypothetical protein